MIQKLTKKFINEPSKSTSEGKESSFDTPRGLEEALLSFLAGSSTGKSSSQPSPLDSICEALALDSKYQEVGKVLSGSLFNTESFGSQKHWEGTCLESPEQWSKVRLLLARLLEECPPEPLLYILLVKTNLRTGPSAFPATVQTAREGLAACTLETPEWLRDQCEKTLAVSLSAMASRGSLDLSDRVKYRQQAEKILMSLLERHQDDPIVLYNLGLLFAEDRQYGQALKYARAALSIAQVSFGPASALVALILSGRRELKSALAVIDYGLLECASLFKHLLILIKAKIHLAMGRSHKAIETVGEYLKGVQPADGNGSQDTSTLEAGRLWQNLTEAFLREGRIKDAEVCLGEMAKVMPSSPDYLFVKGLMKQKEKSIGEAIHNFEKTLALDPSHAPGALALGDVYRIRGGSDIGKQTGDLVMAHSLLSDGLRQQPDEHMGWRNLGLVCKAQGRMEEAKKYLKSAVSLASSAPVLSFMFLPRFL
ncbi:hypothetical protein BSKO_00761 [Bryopsis sp. KO-2023]|nr:hypothetical protein BSKO_00761 [Bryopsis sp. KO-2023]